MMQGWVSHFLPLTGSRLSRSTTTSIEVWYPLQCLHLLSLLGAQETLSTWFTWTREDFHQQEVDFNIYTGFKTIASFVSPRTAVTVPVSHMETSKFWFILTLKESGWNWGKRNWDHKTDHWMNLASGSLKRLKAGFVAVHLLGANIHSLQPGV